MERRMSVQYYALLKTVYLKGTLQALQTSVKVQFKIKWLFNVIKAGT